MSLKLFRLLIVTLLLAMSAVVGFGQNSSVGKLSGSVTDPAGAVVANATVTLKNIATNTVFTSQTNDNGTFDIPALAAGDYTATITATGFKKSEVTGIKINVATQSDIKVQLEIGNLTDATVVVSAASEALLQTQSATVNTTISGRQITELPYASRNALDLLLFLPGTSTAGRPRSSTVNGLPKSMLNITLDGLNIQDNLLKGSDGFFTSIQPKTDAVGEVSMSTSTPGAESNSEGAVQIKFTTRSGGDQFHGSLYETHRDKSLNGNFFWNNELLAPKPHFGQAPSSSDRAPRTNALLNQPGGRIGGPIKIPYIFNEKRKGFFFVNYEEYRLPEAQLRTRTVLSASALAGNYTTGATTVNLYALALANGFTSTPDPTIAALLASTRSVAGSYTATSDPNIDQLSFTNQGGQKRQFPTVRFDFEVNKNNHIETIWNYQVFRSKVDFLNNADPFAPGFPNFGSQDSNRYSTSTAWRTTIKNNLVNEARFGVQSSNTLFFPQNNAAQFLNQGGFAQNISFAASTTTPATAVNGTTSNVTTTNSPQRRNTPTAQFSDNLSWVKGKHSLNFGGDLSSISTFLSSSVNGAVPSIVYGQDLSDPIETTMFNATNFPNASSRTAADQLYRTLTGRINFVNHVASLNEAGTGYTLDGFRTERYRQREIGVFGQDSWRVKSNLTVNFGLRLETVYAPISQNKGLTFNSFAGLFGTSGTNLSALFTPGASGGSATQFTPLPQGQHLYNTAYNLAPTFGLAYQPNFKHGLMKRLTGEPGQTVIRGGWSMAYDREGLNLTSSIVGANFGGTVDLSQFAGTNFARGALFRALPAGPTVPGAPAFPLTPGFFDNASANAFTPNLKTPYVISFSGSVQRELTKDTVIEIGYVGNRGHQLLRQFNLNEVNAVENGFANEFNNARKNLAANIAGGCGTTFALTACAGTTALPQFLAFFQGSSANANLPATYTSSRFTSSTFTSRMVPSNLQALGIAGILAQRGGVSVNDCDPVTPGVQPCAYMQNANNAGLPSNFFVVNPVEFNNLGAGNGTFLVNNDGKTWFDAITIDVRRRLSKGVLFDVNYTFSKALGNEFVSSSIAALNPASIRNTWNNKVASPFDIQSSLKASYVVEAPIGRGKHFLGNSHGIVEGILGNWAINGTLRISSGVPLNMGNLQVVGMNAKDVENAIQIRKDPNHLVFWLPQDIIDNSRRAFNTCIPGTAGCTANGYGTAALTGGLAGGDPTGRYFAPAGNNCISRFTGQCGFTQLIVHGPRFTRADMGIQKKIKLTETMNFELRFEFLNAFNNIDFRLGSFSVDTVNIGAAGIPTFTSAAFGQLQGSDTAYRDVSTTNDPGGRVGQIVLRFNF
jgi:hypothetical protein